MAEVEDAVKLVTDPGLVTATRHGGPDRRFVVNQKRAVRALRDVGAGKAEARELILQALEQVGGGAELRASRGAGRAGDRSGSEIETWWVPAEAVRF